MNTSIAEAIEALKAGKTVIMPTDTVYGLGVSVRHAPTPQEIYDIKRRSADAPIAWLVGGPEALDEFGEDVSPEARSLAQRHWPGSLTIIVKAGDAVPAAYRSVEGTIGMRMPDNQTVLDMVRAVGGPLAVSSANLAGKPAPRSLSELDAALLTRAAALAWDDEPRSGVASTVVDCSQGKPRVLRHGAVAIDGCEPEAARRPQGRAQTIRKGAAMAAETFTVPFTYPSTDGESQVNAKIWTSTAFGSPDVAGPERPKAIIQIVHGMSEHIDRYDTMARRFVENGFIVCAEDHIGHGDTVDDETERGHMPAYGGADILIEDVDSLRFMMTSCYPGVPYVLYGHSMGSFITRVYLARHGEGLAAAVLSGTGNPAVALSNFGRAFARLQAKLRGEKHRSKIIDNMGAGAYGDQIEDARTQFDWLSTDPSVVDAYIADPKSGTMFTVGGYATLLDLTAEMASPECARKAPADTALLFIGGSEDPVGEFGKGVWAAAKLYRDAGVEHVTERIYSGMRHEIHNEVDGDSVFDDVVSWLEDHI